MDTQIENKDYIFEPWPDFAKGDIVTDGYRDYIISKYLGNIPAISDTTGKLARYEVMTLKRNGVPNGLLIRKKANELRRVA